MRLYLVRHGPTMVDPTIPSTRWSLDPHGHASVRTLRRQLPRDVPWFTSPERKAVETARLLTDGTVEIVDDLRECVRTWQPDAGVFEGAIERTFTDPATSPLSGWESASAALGRLCRAVNQLRYRGCSDAILVGHGTAWTLLEAHARGVVPTVADWRSWQMPDLRVVET